MFNVELYTAQDARAVINYEHWVATQGLPKFVGRETF